MEEMVVRPDEFEDGERYSKSQRMVEDVHDRLFNVDQFREDLERLRNLNEGLKEIKRNTLIGSH
jgi:hypothetical protein